MDSEVQKSEQIEEAATRWFARQQSGTWTDVDQAQFDAWLEAATAHRIQHIRVTTAWERAARLKALGAGVPSGVIPPRRSWGDARFFRGTSAETEKHVPQSSSNDHPKNPVADTLTFKRFAAAASILLVLAAGLYLFNADWLAGERYSTPIGGLDTVALDDGSNVILNTDSRIRVNLRERERRIALHKGEAFFDVAKDPARPFVVEAGDKRVTAIGTKFSVRRDGDDIQVVVTEGRVRVETNADPDAGEGPSLERAQLNPSEHEVLLTAGSIARTSRSEVLVRPDSASEAEKLLSWRRGYVSFDNMALADAVAEFNRYNTRKIFIEDPAIAAIRVGGNFRSNNTDAFLDLLQNGFPIAVEESDDKIALKGR